MTIWHISLLVNNHFGVLTRVTGLFSRRGYNIVSLSVGETNLSAYSRITIQTMADGSGIQQIKKQLEKLEDVKVVSLLPGAETIVRELVLAKLIVPFARREALLEKLGGLAVKIAYSDESRLVLEFTGDGDSCAEFLGILDDYTVLELCRTGITAISTTSELRL